MSGNPTCDTHETRLALIEHRQKESEDTLVILSHTCQQINITLARMADYEQRQLEVISNLKELRHEITTVKLAIPTNLEPRLRSVEQEIPPLKETRNWFIGSFVSFVSIILGLVGYIFEKLDIFTK